MTSTVGLASRLRRLVKVPSAAKTVTFPSSEATLKEARSGIFAGCISATANLTARFCADAFAGQDDRELAKAVKIRDAFSAGPDLGGETKAVAIGKWLMGASRVRPALGRWRKLWLVAEALGASRASYTLAQLPHRSGVHWAALPPPSPDPSGMRLSTT